ncbi:MAG: phosphatase PAP2 family protein [Actinomycetota bacterium]
MRSTQERLRVTCVGGALACVAVLVALRVDLVREQGESALDRWVAERLGAFDSESRPMELLQRFMAAPGSRKGALLIVAAIGVSAWLWRRDLRWGVLLAAVFTCTAGTVGIAKIGLVWRLFGVDLGRAYMSEHAANTTAVFGVLLVMSILTHERIVLIAAAGAVAGGTIALVAFSVMSAGHHWLTDVLGGIAVAGAWVFGFTPSAYAMWRRPDLVRALRRTPDDQVRSRPSAAVGAPPPRAAIPRALARDTTDPPTAR